MTTRRAFYLAIVISTCLGTPDSSLASEKGPKQQDQQLQATLLPRETQLWHSPWQDQLQFAFVAHTFSRPNCEADQAPQALTTPDPLTDFAGDKLKITVSFIVGTDGRVHSPFILEGAGTREDQTVLQAVQRWKYRPGLCNGVPTEVEAKIEFSSR